jgi:hypothetical protein
MNEICVPIVGNEKASLEKASKQLFNKNIGCVKGKL